MEELCRKARALGSALEPFAGQVYFSPECHTGYEALGFSGSPAQMNGVAMPDGAAYFCSRGSVMGQVPGSLIAAAFAVFNPAAVVLELAGRNLRVEGKPLFAGLIACGVPDAPLGAAWRFADRLREYRGDAHTSAWTSAGFDATEIGLMSELWWGLPTRSYSRTRAWSDADFDAATARLEARGLMAGGRLTDLGRTAREAVEQTTDAQCRPIIENLGDDFDELIDILTPIGAAIRDAGGYPAAGPHDLADLAARG